MKSELISGQFFFRDTGIEAGMERRLVIACGILAVPPNFPIRGEHQVAVVGGLQVFVDEVTPTLRLYTTQQVDRTEFARGMGMDGLLTSQIWSF